jgi:hypothetical protein
MSIAELRHIVELSALDELASIFCPPHAHLYRLSVDQYDRMARQGILTKYDRIELIEGLLVKKVARNERHIATTWLIEEALQRHLPSGFFLGKEDPISLQRSQPEPDISILRGYRRDYLKRKPRASDALLVIEVSISTYTDDRLKTVLYAEASIPFAWVVNLRECRVEVYSDPNPGDGPPGYRHRVDYGAGDEVPLTIDGREIARIPVCELLPEVAE